MTRREWIVGVGAALGSFIVGPAATLGVGGHAIAGPGDAVVVSIAGGQTLGRADWTSDRVTVRITGLTAGQDFRVEVLDPGGAVLRQQPFTAVGGGSARVTLDTTGVTRPASFTVQVRSLPDGALVARGQGTPR